MRNLSSAPDAARSDIPDAAALDACLANIAEKNTAALEELYRGTSASVYGFALSILKNAPDAQDVMHDCYVSIYSAAAGYRSSGKPMAWILTIVRNLCLRKLRESRKTADLPPEEWERVLEEREEVEPEDKLVLSACMRLLSMRSGKSGPSTPCPGSSTGKSPRCWGRRCPPCCPSTAGR